MNRKSADVCCGQGLDQWDPDALMRRRFYADLLLFDLTDGGKIVAERRPGSRSQGGVRLTERMEEEAWHLTEAHFREYDPRPVIAEIDGGVGVILPFAAPAASLGIVLIPTLPRKAFLSGLRRMMRRDAVWQSSLWEESDGYRFSQNEEQRRGIESILQEIELCAEIQKEKNLARGILSMSALAGCPVSVYSEDAPEGEGINAELGSIFLLSLFLLCRRISPCRSATVSIGECSMGKTIEIKFPVESGEWEREEPRELLFLRMLADRKRIPFDYVKSDLFCNLSVCPVLPDWSYLGIKQPEDRRADMGSNANQNG